MEASLELRPPEPLSPHSRLQILRKSVSLIQRMKLEVQYQMSEVDHHLPFVVGNVNSGFTVTCPSEVIT